jgi:hypothetical protein
MSSEEAAVVDFLSSFAEAYTARREIGRRALGRLIYEENPHWIDAPLAALLMQGVIEQNDSAAYRLKRRY